MYPLRLSDGFGGPAGAVRGVMIVEMLDSDRIRVEITTNASATDFDFTSAARIYVR